MDSEKYIKEKMKELSMNIDEFFIGENIIDNDNEICSISNKTLNTIEVFMKAKKKSGIDCKNWFTMKEFNQRFKKI